MPPATLSGEPEGLSGPPARDEDDWPVLAAAIALGCAIWTEDTDCFGSGIAVWTTNSIEIFLQKEVKRAQNPEE